MTKNEKESIELVRDLNEEQIKRLYSFMQKFVICSRTFGEEYDNEIKPFVKSQNVEKLEEITDKYIARLSTDGSGILIDGVKVK